jgi:hypothetical protein
MKHILSDILPDYGDRDFVLGVLSNYILDHIVKHLKEPAESDWYYEHAEYANDILKRMGGIGHNLEKFKESRGIFKK